MGRTCVICKKEQNPFESRSFHKFPADDELKQKWISAIGLSSVTKNTVICEDHFDDSAFHNTEGYTVRRRLLSNAIPKNKSSQDHNILLQVSDLNSSINSDHNYTKCFDTSNLTNIESECIDISDEMVKEDDSETIVNMESTSNSCKKYGQSMISLESIVESVDVSNKIMKENVVSEDAETGVNMNNNINISKRKLASVKVHPTKRIRFKIGFKTEHLSREDFVSDESWQRFLRCHINNKRQLKVAKKRNALKQKRIYEYRLLISTLL